MLKMKKPAILTGITSENSYKPDFVMVYDHADRTSAVNWFAQNLTVHLPHYELSKTPLPPSIRGPVVLSYRPTRLESKVDGSITYTNPKDKKWTINQLRNVVKFHTTEACADMYASHDNPIHRACGGEPWYSIEMSTDPFYIPFFESLGVDTKKLDTVVGGDGPNRGKVFTTYAQFSQGGDPNTC